MLNRMAIVAIFVMALCGCSNTEKSNTSRILKAMQTSNESTLKEYGAVNYVQIHTFSIINEYTDKIPIYGAMSPDNPLQRERVGERQVTQIVVDTDCGRMTFTWSERKLLYVNGHDSRWLLP